MEDELTELSEIESETDNLAVTEEADFDEDIAMYLLKPQRHKHTKRQYALILIRLTVF